MQRIDDRSCQESDISGANRHRRTAHQRKQAIEEPRWPALERPFSFRLGAYALHDDSAGAPRVEERGNRFGRAKDYYVEAPTKPRRARSRTGSRG